MAELAFDCVGARADKYAVSPSMSLVLRIAETSGQKVEAIALRCQIRIEPTRRRYSDAEAERLNDLFGDTQRWADTLKPLQFTNVSVMVPAFTGSTEVELPVMLSYDLEIGSTRYFAGLDDGEIPLLLLFSGTVFTSVDGRLQAQQVPWSKEAAYRLPVALWREAIDMHFPESAWIRMKRHTLDELLRFKNREALPTWDATIAALLARAAPRGTALEEPREHRIRGRPRPGRARRSCHEAPRASSTPAGLPTRSCTRGTCCTRTAGRRRRTRCGSSSGAHPPAYCDADPSENSAFQTECLAECADDAQVLVTVRFLHLQHRTVQEVPPDGGEPVDVASLEVDGTEYTSCRRPRNGSSRPTASVGALLGKERNLEFHIGAGESTEDLVDADGRRAGRLTRRWAALDGRIQLSAARVAGPWGAAAAAPGGEPGGTWPRSAGSPLR